MSDATQYSEEVFIGRTFEGTAPPAPVNPIYVCLWGINPANNPASANEITGDTYARQTVDPTGWTRLSTSEPTRVTNANPINFGQLSSTTAITVEGVVLADGADPATCNYLYANGDIAVSVAAGNGFQIDAGGATFGIR